MPDERRVSDISIRHPFGLSLSKPGHCFGQALWQPPCEWGLVYGFGLVKFELFVMRLGRGFDRLSLNGWLSFNGPDQQGQFLIDKIDSYQRLMGKR